MLLIELKGSVHIGIGDVYDIQKLALSFLNCSTVGFININWNSGSRT